MSTLKYPTLLKPLALSLVAALGGIALAEDVRLGGARTFGMAGAGVALPVDVYETHRLNPALLGFAGAKLRFGVPYLGYHTRRILVSDISDLLGDIDSGVEDDAVIKLARRFGNSSKEVGVSAGFGLSGGHFAFSGGMEAQIRSVPNRQLKAFLASGDDNFENTPIDARLDAYGLGYYETNTSYGNQVMKGKVNLSVGATFRTVSAFYAHKVADADAIANNDGIRNGVEISSDDDVIQRSGIGVDLGAVGTLQQVPNAYFGVNVRNLVEPNVSFVRTGPDTDFPLRRDIRPFRREINAGVAYVQGRYLAAADLVDLGNHAGNAGFRIGGEVSLNKYLALRAGYDTNSKFVIGANIGGVNIAYAPNGTTSIVSAIRF